MTVTRRSRSRRRRGARAALLAVLLVTSWAPASTAGTGVLESEWVTLEVGPYELPARVPRGWTIEMLSVALGAPRILTFHPNGDLFAGSRADAVYRIPPPYTEPELLVRLAGYPHSVAFRDGEILIARTDGLYRAPYAPGQATIAPRDVVLLSPFPAGGGHDSRTVRIGPDGRVYASLGLSGNCSDEYLGGDYDFDRRRGGVVVLVEQDGAARWEPYASGLRNPIGFDWHPSTARAYATNNGPDHLGFEQPPERFAHLEPGSFHGMPWFQWNGTSNERDACSSSTPPIAIADVAVPVATFPARSAPMDVTFVPDGALAPVVEGDAVVAIHGSWGTPPSGGPEGDPSTRRPPRLAVVRFDAGAPVRVDDLVTGFQLEDGRRWARPVGVAIGPDGALYFTSDAGIQGLFRLRAR